MRRGYCNRLHLSVCLSICPLCYLLLNHWTKFNQICCVSYSHKWGVQRQYFLPRDLGSWGEVKYHLIAIKKLISKIFISNFVCVLTNERYKTYQTGLSFFYLGHDPGLGHRGPRGHFFSNMFMWHIKSTGMTSRTECKYNFLGSNC